MREDEIDHKNDASSIYHPLRHLEKIVNNGYGIRNSQCWNSKSCLVVVVLLWHVSLLIPNDLLAKCLSAHVDNAYRASEQKRGNIPSAITLWEKLFSFKSKRV